MGAIAVLVTVSDYSFGYFSRDPASTLSGSPVVGLLSYIGILIAWGTAVACVLAASYVARARGWRHASVLVAAGLGTAYLALDDLFQVHEEIIPNYLWIPQEAVLAGYAVAALGFIWHYRMVLRAHEWPLLALAFLVLGASLGLDQSGDYVLSEVSRYLEEGFKLFGLALLATYLFRLGRRMHAEAYPLLNGAGIGKEGSRTARMPVGASDSAPRPAVTPRG